jgi:hypothetical protein
MEFRPIVARIGLPSRLLSRKVYWGHLWMQSDPKAPPPLHEQHQESEPMLYCPVCNNRLTELKCKLVCDRCGYYMSCSDYY